MKVHIKLLGVMTIPLYAMTYHYLLTAENGLVDERWDHDYIEDGDYEMDDEEWK